MSRVTRLKNKKRKMKNRIKATSCCLTLALVIGISQGIGTYALFTDSEDIPSDISLSTGDVDVEVNDGKKLENVKSGDEIKIPFTITNKGTLKQNITVSLNISDSIKKYLINPNVKFKSENISLINGALYNGSDLFVLLPGQSIEGNINTTVATMDKVTQNNLVGKPQDIDLTVKSTQINKGNTLVNNGFYDIAVQENTINMAERPIITVATGEYAHIINENGNKYTAIYMPVNENGMPTVNKPTITITPQVTGNSKIKYKATYIDQGKYKYIKITNSNGESIGFQDTWNITLNIKIGDEEEYSQLCWINQNNAENSNCRGDQDGHPHDEDTKRCQIQKVNPGNTTYSTTKEMPTTMDIREEVSESQAVEQPKEEVVEPSEPEVIESSGEKIIKQPEAVEPPKETEDLQE